MVNQVKPCKLLCNLDEQTMKIYMDAFVVKFCSGAYKHLMETEEIWYVFLCVLFMGY